MHESTTQGRRVQSRVGNKLKRAKYVGWNNTSLFGRLPAFAIGGLSPEAIPLISVLLLWLIIFAILVLGRWDPFVVDAVLLRASCCNKIMTNVTIRSWWIEAHNSRGLLRCEEMPRSPIRGKTSFLKCRCCRRQTCIPVDRLLLRPPSWSQVEFQPPNNTFSHGCNRGDILGAIFEVINSYYFSDLRLRVGCANSAEHLSLGTVKSLLLVVTKSVLKVFER